MCTVGKSQNNFQKHKLDKQDNEKHKFSSKKKILIIYKIMVKYLILWKYFRTMTLVWYTQSFFETHNNWIHKRYAIFPQDTNNFIYMN